MVLGFVGPAQFGELFVGGGASGGVSRGGLLHGRGGPFAVPSRQTLPHLGVAVGGALGGAT